MKRARGALCLAVALVAAGLPVAAGGDGQDDCGSGGDAGNERADATALAGPVDCLGRLDPAWFLVGWAGDVEDWYGFLAQKGQPLDLTLAPLVEESITLCLHPPTESWTTCNYAFGGDAPIDMVANETGQWFAQVQLGGGPVEYRFQLSIGAVCDVGPNEQAESGLIEAPTWVAPVPGPDPAVWLTLETVATTRCETARLWGLEPADVAMYFWGLWTDGVTKYELADYFCWYRFPSLEAEDCYVPPGARWAELDVHLGGPTHFEFRYRHF